MNRASGSTAYAAITAPSAAPLQGASGTNGQYLDPASGLSSNYSAATPTFACSTGLFVYYLGTTNPNGALGGIVA